MHVCAENGSLECLKMICTSDRPEHISARNRQGKTDIKFMMIDPIFQLCMVFNSYSICRVLRNKWFHFIGELLNLYLNFDTDLESHFVVSDDEFISTLLKTTPYYGIQGWPLYISRRTTAT